MNELNVYTRFASIIAVCSIMLSTALYGQNNARGTIKVAEDKEIGSLVGRLSTVDKDKNDTHTYTIGGTDASIFFVDGSEVKTATTFDYETQDRYEITITVTDQAGASLSRDYDVIITDVEESIELSNHTIVEGVSNRVIGTLSYRNPDTYYSYEILTPKDTDSKNSDTDVSSLFRIEDGVLMTNKPLVYDNEFDEKNIYTVSIKVKGENGITLDQTPVVIEVTPDLETATITPPEIRVYPNPVEDIAHLYVDPTIDAEINILVYDMSGMLVAEMREYISINTNSPLSVNTNAWASGSYIVYVEANGVQNSTILLKQ